MSTSTVTQLTADQVQLLIEQIQVHPIDTAMSGHIARVRAHRSVLSWPHFSLVLVALCRAAQTERVLVDQVGGFVTELFPPQSPRWRAAMAEVQHRLAELSAAAQQRTLEAPAQQLSFFTSTQSVGAPPRPGASHASRT
jgi:hypothetical protein